VTNAIVCFALIVGSTGSFSVVSGSAITAGGFITIVGAIGVASVIGAVFMEGHERDHAAWGPPQRRQVEMTASHLFGAWVWGHLGHAGLLGHAVTWWPSWKHFEHWSGVGVGDLDGSH
jgi:uncharacterized membrane protein